MDADYDAAAAAGHAFVADDGGELVGFIVLVDDTDHLLAENVAVEPSRQGAGHGRALHAFGEDVARDRGFSGTRLYTHEAMTEDLRLYAALGYHEDERRPEARLSRVLLSKRRARGAP